MQTIIFLLQDHLYTDYKRNFVLCLLKYLRVEYVASFSSQLEPVGLDEETVKDLIVWQLFCSAAERPSSGMPRLWNHHQQQLGVISYQPRLCYSRIANCQSISHSLTGLWLRLYRWWPLAILGPQTIFLQTAIGVELAVHGCEPSESEGLFLCISLAISCLLGPRDNLTFRKLYIPLLRYFETNYEMLLEFNLDHF